MDDVEKLYPLPWRVIKPPPLYMEEATDPVVRIVALNGKIVANGVPAEIAEFMIRHMNAVIGLK